MKATRRRHGWVHMFSTHRRTLTIQLHNFDLFRTCHTSSFCTVVWQLARFQLTRRIARSLGDSWASCIPLGMQYPGIDALRIKRRKNRLSGFGSRCAQNLGHKKRKTKNHATVTFRPYVQTPPMGRSFWILACAVISPTLSPYDKFCVNRFRGFRVLTPPIFPFSIGLAGRPTSPSLLTDLDVDCATL